MRCNNSDCGSTMGYLRLKTNEWVCRSCGSIQTIEKEVDDNDIQKEKETRV